MAQKAAVRPALATAILFAAAVTAFPAPEIPVPFPSGERLTYDVSWSTYLTAGTATFTVRTTPRKDGSKAYHVVAEARPTPLLSSLYALYYKADTVIDGSTLLPERGSIYGREGTRQRTRITRFDRATQRAYFEQVGGMKRELAAPPRVHDALSALYAVRAANLRPGALIKIPVCDSGRIYSVLLKVGAVEPVTTTLGTTQAYRIVPQVLDAQGRPAPGRVTFWLGADQRRMPLKFESEVTVGRFVAVLREVAGPSR